MTTYAPSRTPVLGGRPDLRRARRGHYLAHGDVLTPLHDKITALGRCDEGEPQAIIVLHGRFARVLDNHSPEGTYLNGRRISATNIVDGDVIQVGSDELRYIVID